MMESHYAVGYDTEMDPSEVREAILDVYADCLDAVKGTRERARGGGAGGPGGLDSGPLGS